jgi:diketogulonate reductase-like aldo/keto reductase
MKIIPKIIYGTAWKEDKTETLVSTAIEMGFRAIDTANQPRHYNEEAVGEALSKALSKGMNREEIFIQTKFTPIDGRDHRSPYDDSTDSATQVRQSFQSSLEHLQVDHIDSYILHGPHVPTRLSEEDWLIWKEMEDIQQEGEITQIGISNVNIDQLQLLYEGATIKPSYVQNRCYAKSGWDKVVREYCKEKNIIYQGFSLLTANPLVLSRLSNIAKAINKTPAQIIFRFSQHLGMVPLSGTTNKTHMKEDLSLNFDLEDEEITFIENIFQY